MPGSHLILLVAAGLILAKGLAQLLLEHLNQRQVKAHAAALPHPFRALMNGETYRRTVDYTLAKSRFAQLEITWETVLLLGLLVSGVLPPLYQMILQWGQGSPWAGGAFLFLIATLLALPELPLAWYQRFRLEQRFGFNTATQRTWWIDKAKGLLLALLLGYPLLVLILYLVSWTGSAWWLWAWGALLGIQLLMLVLAPVLILPWFNTFTPLPEGPLRDRLLALGHTTGFHSQSIQVMDGSKRSRHSNAYFTGFGRFRKIVLFDTLLQQLSHEELEAVLAHEIGHYKLKHIPKLLLGSALSMLGGLWLIALLSQQPWFYVAFGFAPGSIVPALLLFALLAGSVTFWFSPLAHFWSRRHEYQADGYAAETLRGSQSLIGALRQLTEKNLSNLTPHPLYSAFYYSHPTLLERERALEKWAERP